jgi:hypothetical protein
MDSCGACLEWPAGNNVQELQQYIWEHWAIALDDLADGQDFIWLGEAN